jgi:hypothetical protein
LSAIFSDCKIEIDPVQLESLLDEIHVGRIIFRQKYSG